MGSQQGNKQATPHVTMEVACGTANYMLNFSIGHTRTQDMLLQLISAEMCQLSRYMSALLSCNTSAHVQVDSSAVRSRQLSCTLLAQMSVF